MLNEVEAAPPGGGYGLIIRVIHSEQGWNGVLGMREFRAVMGDQARPPAVNQLKSVGYCA